MGARVVVIGTSWGGLHALRRIAGDLPADFPVPIAVVQHRHRDSDQLLRQLLQDGSALVVSEVEDKEPMLGGHVYIAPPDYHLLVEEDHFSLSVDPPVRFSRPSIDVTFDSAATSLGAGVIGVVLTGANADGAEGLRRIVRHGGRAIVQDPAEAESAVMPEAARRAVPEAVVLPLEEIAPYLVRLVRARPSALGARPSATPQARAEGPAEAQP